MADTGFYMYIEASGRNYGEFADMISPPLISPATGTTIQVRFGQNNNFS